MVKSGVKSLKQIDEMSDIWMALTYEERMYLRENTKYQEFKKNEIIYCEGEVPEFMYCVISGKIKIFKNGIGGRQQILRFIREGENFAFRAYFAEGKYVTSASALEAVKAYAVPLTVIRQILESNNRLAMLFINICRLTWAILIRVLLVLLKNIFVVVWLKLWLFCWIRMVLII